MHPFDLIGKDGELQRDHAPILELYIGVLNTLNFIFAHTLFLTHNGNDFLEGFATPVTEIVYIGIKIDVTVWT